MIVHGKKFKVIPWIISHLFDIRNEVVNLIETTNIYYQRMIEIFSREGEPHPLLVVNTRGQNKGFQRMSIPEPWRIEVSWIIKYFTCEGQCAIIVGPPFWLLIHLCHGVENPELRVNLPAFLSDSIVSMIERFKIILGPLKHHGLIQLICKYHFPKEKKNRGKMVENSPKIWKPWTPKTFGGGWVIWTGGSKFKWTFLYASRCSPTSKS